MTTVDIVELLRGARCAMRSWIGIPAGRRLPRKFLGLAAVLVFSGLLRFSASADDKRLTVYSNVASYSVGLIDRNGQEYVSLLDAIEPLGSVSASSIGSRWRLRYNDVESDFAPGASRARVRGGDFELRSPFVLENGRGLVPLVSLGNLMSKILGGPVSLHQDARRVFVGSVAIHFTAQIEKSTPPKLVVTFTAPVNPMIATEPGKLTMTFSRDPVVSPGSPALTFDSKIIPSASYEEGNGTASVTVSATAPLFASFSDGNRTITIAAAPQAESQAAAPAHNAPAQPAPAPTPAPPAQNGSTAEIPPVTYFAVVDASHGGTDRGEDLPEHLEEKDVTLNLGRALRQELQSRGISTLLIRDGASGLTLDQRASMTNFAHPVIYICLHASSQGSGVRLYTALLPEGGQNIGTFFDWDTAQSAFLPLSQTAASGIAAEFQKKQVPSRILMAPLRPLNNVATAAIAIEVAPPAQGAAGFNASAYQQLIASTVTSGVLSARAKLEAGR
jgi:N-acetylmuramoyl-L-alanine amidase